MSNPATLPLGKVPPDHAEPVGKPLPKAGHARFSANSRTVARPNPAVICSFFNDFAFALEPAPRNRQLMRRGSNCPLRPIEPLGDVQ
jgi:hypothetical protein